MSSETPLPASPAEIATARPLPRGCAPQESCCWPAPLSRCARMLRCRSTSRPCRSLCSLSRCCCSACCCRRGWRPDAGRLSRRRRAGLPVFAPGPAGRPGLAHLFGPTGGLPAGLSLCRDAHRVRSIAAAGADLAPHCSAPPLGNVVILGIGALWLAFSPMHPHAVVLTQAVIPFLPGDALKVMAAAAPVSRRSGCVSRQRNSADSPHNVVFVERTSAFREHPAI